MLARLGAWAARRRIPIVVAWAALTLLGVVFGGGVYDRTETVDTGPSGTESAAAKARLDSVSPEDELVVAVIAGRDFNAIDLVNDASRVMFEIRAMPGVVEVTDAYTAGSGQVSADNQRSLVLVELDPALDDEAALAVADDVAAALRTIDAPEVLVGGRLLAERAFGEQAIEDAILGESVAVVVLAIALVVLLGGLVAGGLPLAGALVSVAGTLLALYLITLAVPVSEFAVNVVTLLGIGLAIDYSLLMIYRFREERAADRRALLPDLLARTMATAGRAVLVSGLAVAATLSGLFAFADPLLAAMALGGALAAVVAVGAALTLVPALIAVAHRRIQAPTPRWRRGALLPRLAAFAQRRPVAVTVAVVAGLLLLSLPLLQVNLGNSDVRALPADAEERRTYEVMLRDFRAAAHGPVTVVVEGAPTDPPVLAFLERVESLAGVDYADTRDDVTAGVTVVDVIAVDPASGEALVRQIRALDSEATVLVAGPAAELVDTRELTARHLPIALIVIIGASGLLLFALTGSVVVPVKALLLNLVTLAATLGVLVVVFQWGIGASVLGFDPWGALDITTPLLLFVFIFALSMDYEVFLLARIKEEWDRRSADDRAASDRAVLAGIRATGPVVTAAALLIGIVFLGFVLGDLVAVKEIGVGMAVAVLLDVTVARGLLLPATMSLLGRANWWGPRWRVPPVAEESRENAVETI